MVKIPTAPEKKTKKSSESVPKTGKVKSKKESQDVISSNEIGFLIQSAFGLVALRAGEHWNITSAETNQIAVPLTNILKKMDLLEKVSNISDGTALTLAVASITIPRIIVSTNNSKKKKEGKEDGKGNRAIPDRKSVTGAEGKNTSNSSEPSQHNNGGSAEVATIDGQSLKTLASNSIIQY